MARLEFSINNKQFDDWKRKLSSNLNRLSAFTARSVNIMHADVVKHFDVDDKNSDGTPWLPTTGLNKRGKTLVRSGTLRGSIWKVSDASGGAIGTNLEYAKTHNYGASYFIRPINRRVLSWITANGNRAFSRGHKITIPKREFMWISDSAQDQITTLFRDEFIPN